MGAGGGPKKWRGANKEVWGFKGERERWRGERWRGGGRGQGWGPHLENVEGQKVGRGRGAKDGGQNFALFRPFFCFFLQFTRCFVELQWFLRVFIIVNVVTTHKFGA